MRLVQAFGRTFAEGDQVDNGTQLSYDIRGIRLGLRGLLRPQSSSAVFFKGLALQPKWQQLDLGFAIAFHRSACRGNAWALMLALLASLLSPAQNFAQSRQPIGQDLLVQQLIQQLDSPEYDQRQSAMAQLKDFGSNAIEPLAEKLIDGTPESCARIKQILPAIAMRGGRDELFQVLAVLNLRFNVDFEQMNTLVSEWTISRRQVTIERLRDSGAQVLDEFDGGEDLRRAQLRAARMIAVEPRPVLLQQEEFEIQLQVAGERIEIDGDQPKQVEKPRVRPGTGPSDDSKSQPDQLSMDVALAQRLQVSAEQNERWLLARNQGRKFLNANATASQLPIKVVLSPDWNGQLEALDQTIAISELVLKEIKLTPELFAAFSKQSVQRVVFENCLLSAGQESFRLPAGLRSIVVQQSGDASQLLGKLADDQVEVFQLKLVGSGKGQQPLGESIMGFKSIFNLELENFDLDEKSFDQIAKLSGLKMLTLSRCKFAPEDYRKFDIARKTLRKTFTGKALLGVRGLGSGLIGRGQSSCQVTEVVPGAAADQAGVEAGDIIVGIGKHAVKEFADLRLLIAGYDIGDEVEIKVQRDGKTLNLKAKLGDAQAVNPF